MRERWRGEKGIEWRDFPTLRYDLTGSLPWCKSLKKHYSEVFYVECSVVWCRDLDTTTEWAKTTGSIWDVGMEKDRACKIDRQNKKKTVVLQRVGEGRIMLELIRKRKRNWLGHWLRRNCLLKDALEHGCTRVAHCVPAQWPNFSHYCCPLRQYDVFWAHYLTTICIFWLLHHPQMFVF